MRSERASFLFLVAVLSLAGCRKPDSDLGLGLQPEGELLDLRTDTLNFSVEMVPVDSFEPMSAAACCSATPSIPSVVSPPPSFPRNCVCPKPPLILARTRSATA